jgi:hypothetical protein
MNKQHYTGINLTNMRYAHPWTEHVWQPFATISYDQFGSHFSLVHIFHVIPHAGLFVGGPYTIPMLISRGMVAYHLTTIIIEQRQFTGPHKCSMRLVHNKMLVQESTMNSLNWHRWRLPPYNFKYPHFSPRSSHSMILRFSLVVPSDHKFKTSNHSFHSLSNLNHFNFIKV